MPNPNAPEPQFATFFSQSWLLSRLGLSDSAARPIAFVLAAIATIGLVAAGLGLLGILIPFAWWSGLAVFSALDSLLLLVAFWNPYLILGVLIDLAVLAAVILADWTPE